MHTMIPYIPVHADICSPQVISENGKVLLNQGSALGLQLSHSLQAGCLHSRVQSSWHLLIFIILQYSILMIAHSIVA